MNKTHLYTATNKYHRSKKCTIEIPANAGLITSIRHIFFVPYNIIHLILPSFLFYDFLKTIFYTLHIVRKNLKKSSFFSLKYERLIFLFFSKDQNVQTLFGIGNDIDIGTAMAPFLTID